MIRKEDTSGEVFNSLEELKQWINENLVEEINHSIDVCLNS